ncbi:McrC family protein [Rhabdobacter roseus]|uniref:5-methylcytosine-specific restriction enzyme subunit McrC n=1 Tax=Rhabdobacter roseus TaxID=1655419 RepID=A0A840TH96_9BACT|nr:hypothetical protein [Rhabdobacter roseus]MBB5282631.1 5-methylcytosine-specific restriction enzyme subunit McrC [Rhabdobacter roseus]
MGVSEYGFLQKVPFDFFLNYPYGLLYSLPEHSLLTPQTALAPEPKGTFALPARTFGALKAYAVQAEAAPVLTYFVQRGREYLRVGAWVGLLQVPDGTTLELLPKLSPGTSEDDALHASRRVLLRMLRAVPTLPFRVLPEAQLSQWASWALPEVLAALFLQQAERLLHQGLQTHYQPIEQEQAFVKGKIQLNRVSQSTLLRPERLPLRFDERTRNNAPNRLLKACLWQLRQSTPNARRVRQYLFTLDDIPASVDWAQDLALARRNDRRFVAYAWLWPWVEWLLGGRAPGLAPGTARLPGLLFPTAQLFEAYVSHSLRRYLPAPLSVHSQEARYHLLRTPGGTLQHRLRPDVVIRHGHDSWVLDIKWKEITATPDHTYGVAQPDLYQLYAYGRRYLRDEGRVKLALLYPGTATFSEASLPFRYEEDLPLSFVPVELSVPAPEMVARLWEAIR